MKKPFNRQEVLESLRKGDKQAVLEYDLTCADLTGANLTDANLDFSCLPLWCGSLNMKVDKRIACQLAYHLCSLECDDEEFVQMRNSILDFANQFHRVGECGKLLPIKRK